MLPTLGVHKMPTWFPLKSLIYIIKKSWHWILFFFCTCLLENSASNIPIIPQKITPHQGAVVSAGHDAEGTAMRRCPGRVDSPNRVIAAIKKKNDGNKTLLVLNAGNFRVWSKLSIIIPATPIPFHSLLSSSSKTPMKLTDLQLDQGLKASNLMASVSPEHSKNQSAKH